MMGPGGIIQMISMKSQQLLLLSGGLLTACLSWADTSAVSVEQMRQAASAGAVCSGFYDGVYRLVDKAGDAERQQLAQISTELDRAHVFRWSTSAMLMTDIFIRQTNRHLHPDPAWTLQTFSQDYVAARKQAMGWQAGKSITQLQQQQTHCQHILTLATKNGSLNETMIDQAVAQRAKALGLELEDLSP